MRKKKEREEKSEPNEKRRDEHQDTLCWFSFCETHARKQIKQQEESEREKNLSSSATSSETRRERERGEKETR